MPLAEGDAMGGQIDIYDDNNFRFNKWIFNAGLHFQISLNLRL